MANTLFWLALVWASYEIWLKYTIVSKLNILMISINATVSFTAIVNLYVIFFVLNCNTSFRYLFIACYNFIYQVLPQAN